MKYLLKVNYREGIFFKHYTCISLIILIAFSTGCTHTGKSEQTTTEWKFSSQREEISPAHWVDTSVLFDGNPTLALAGDNREYTNGSWTYTYDVVPNNFYRFITYFKPKNLDQIDRSILVKITWQSIDGKNVELKEFPGTEAELSDNDWFSIQQTYKVPENAVKAKVDLIFRWSANGSVFFGGTSFEKAPAIASRNVRLATIHHRPRNTDTPEENLTQFQQYIEMAGDQNADFVCLPEGTTVCGTKKSYVEVSESIPGSSTSFLGALAKKYDMYIIAGIYEREGDVVYNTSVLIGRDGTLAGKYRKVFLPQEEIAAGLTPGNSFPVFDTDFGKVGMMICWDTQFPEAARKLALNGAEIIFFPVWGGNTTLVRARAIENQVFIVSSSYDMESGIFDQTGELIAEGTEENPVAIIEVDLNKRNLIPWLGEFKNRIKREMPENKVINY